MPRKGILGFPFNLAIIRPKPSDSTLLRLKKPPHFGFRYSFRGFGDVFNECQSWNPKESNENCFRGTVSVAEGNTMFIYSSFVDDIDLEVKERPMICEIANAIVNRKISVNSSFVAEAVQTWRSALASPIKSEPILQKIREGLNLIKGARVSNAINYILNPSSVEEAIAGDIILFAQLANKYNVWYVPVLYFSEDEWTLVSLVIDVRIFEALNYVDMPKELRNLFLVGGVYKVICPPYMVAQTGIADNCTALIEQVMKKTVSKEGKAAGVFNYTYYIRQIDEEKYEGDFVFISSCVRAEEIARVLDPQKAEKVYKVIEENLLGNKGQEESNT